LIHRSASRCSGQGCGDEVSHLGPPSRGSLKALPVNGLPPLSPLLQLPLPLLHPLPRFPGPVLSRGQVVLRRMEPTAVVVVDPPIDDLPRPEVSLRALDEHSFRQERRVRPGPDTKYRRITTERWQVRWQVDEEAIAYDLKSDGRYPLLSNDLPSRPARSWKPTSASPPSRAASSRARPSTKSPPFYSRARGASKPCPLLYFLALPVSALLERDLHRVMAREEIQELPLFDLRKVGPGELRRAPGRMSCCPTRPPSTRWRHFSGEGPWTAWRLATAVVRS